MENPLSSTILSTTSVATCLHTTPSYIIVALDNGELHVLSHDGRKLGYVNWEQAFWCLDDWNDEWVVAGGLGGRIGVWELSKTGEQLKEKVKLEGHTGRGDTSQSTVRSVKVLSATKLVSSSRDMTVRIWNLEKGECTAVLEGHTGSVRSIAVHEDLIVSASYDSTARIWSLETKKCLHVLDGHASQIYSVVFDGKKIITGSLDATARIWDPVSGQCLAVLQHGSLVGHLQLQGRKLITGDSTGTLRVWSLDDYCELHQVAAHRYSVTSLACDENIIVSGGSDGSVKLWDLETGQLQRDLCISDAVWKVGLLTTELIVAAFSRNHGAVLQTWGMEA